MKQEKLNTHDGVDSIVKLQGKKLYTKPAYKKHETIKVAAAATNCAAPDPGHSD
mgnify:CR=1 FL=1